MEVAHNFGPHSATTFSGASERTDDSPDLMARAPFDTTIFASPPIDSLKEKKSLEPFLRFGPIHWNMRKSSLKRGPPPTNYIWLHICQLTYAGFKIGGFLNINNISALKKYILR